MKSEPVIKIVGTECPPELEKEWNTYFDEKHIPDIFQYKDAKKITRYKIKDVEMPVNIVEGVSKPPAKYITIYEYDNWEKLHTYEQSQGYRDVINDWITHWTPRGVKIVSRTVYQQTKSWIK